MTALAIPRPAQERAMLQSVVYASLFDYPVTLSQLREGLIGEVADERTLLAWYEASAYLQATVDYAGGFFFPRGRADLLDRRAEREVTSRALLRSMSAPLALISRLPFVRMVAISGSLAHLNADREADLDLFVVTSPHRVWTVTVATLALAHLLGWRDRLCLNYVVSERALWIAPADLFSANQIVHLRPLTGGETYRRFLETNRFVQRFYPNFAARALPQATPVSRVRRALDGILDWTMAPVLEPLCRLLYRTHLRTRAHTWKSRDQVRLEPECLKLHTSSHRHQVMERFERALEEAMAIAEQHALKCEESQPLPVCR
jgi:hypothetical protein